MNTEERFDEYVEHLAAGLRHADRHEGLKGYCTGLMLPLARKSVEPMAARVDPLHASARHQALHHFVAKADWSDEDILRRVREWVFPKMDPSLQAFWIVDDVGFPKKGHHSVGVTRQYCGVLGKQDNCQVAVSLSLATEQASLPTAYRLYLPEGWANDTERRRRAGVPDDVKFATKPEIALAQLEAMLSEGAPRYCVLADAAYGTNQAFRQRLTELGLPYVVGIVSSVVVWPPDVQPLPPKPYNGRGRPPIMPRRTPQRQPVSVKDLALVLPMEAFRTVCWREGTNDWLSGRFAAARVRHAGGNAGKARLQPEQWLLIEWPEGDAEPLKYFLSTLPETISLDDLVAQAHMRWRIERDYQELKQEFGLDHYEGRGWRGFHHHATLCIAAYGFLIAERVSSDPRGDGKKSLVQRQVPPIPENYLPRGSPARATACS